MHRWDKKLMKSCGGVAGKRSDCEKKGLGGGVVGRRSGREEERLVGGAVGKRSG